MEYEGKVVIVFETGEDRAYDLGEEEIAKELLQFVLNLVTVQTSDKNIKSRLEKIVKKCYLISSKINYLIFPA